MDMPAKQEAVRRLILDLIDAGCDPVAMRDSYVLNEPEDPEARRAVQIVLDAFGPRKHLTSEISVVLRKQGRVHDP